MDPARAHPSALPDDWRWHHARAARNLDEVEALFPGRFDLSRLDRPRIDAAAARYGMRATPCYLDLAERADPADPIWALAVPDPAELDQRPEELEDPIGDEAHRPLPGLVRRYEDRVLLSPTPVCSVHCRHCFRKRLVGRAEHALDEAALDRAVAWIAERPTLREVILTGGDPLTLSDGRLLTLLGRLDRLEHLRSLRLHSRMPVVNPYRITTELAAGLGRLGTPVMVVTHFNHPRELAAPARQALERLRAAGVERLNQAVLLAGINDTVAVQRALIEALLDARVRPYALHHADRVPGTAHRRTTLARGRALMATLRGTVPGHALPRYLLDLPGGHGKVPVEPDWLTELSPGRYEVRAPDGSRQRYDDPGGTGGPPPA